MDVNAVGSLVLFYEKVYASLKNEMEVISQFLIKLEVSKEEGRAIHDAATLKIVRDSMEKDVKEVSETAQSIIEKLEQLDTVHASNKGCKEDSPTDQCFRNMRNSYITQVEEVLNVVTSLAGVETQSTDGADSFTYSWSDTDSMISMRKRLEGMRMVDSLAGVEIQRVDRAEVFIIQLQGVAKRFSYDELQMATRGFSEKLGDGGFGTVYRGVLPPRIPVAVKRMNAHSTHGQGMKEFKGEVSIITQLRHRNLIELQGWCEDQARKEYMLVYELMPNGSLDHLLFKDSVKRGGAAGEGGTEAKGGKGGVVEGTFCLSWPQRFKILTGIADALDYLHQGWKHQVIHGDIKCANILLDKEWNAKLTDFGLSRLVDRQGEAYTIHFAGTRGYAAPELFTEGKFTDKSDVFAFGAVVLEVVCGRRNWPGDAHEMSLVEWVREGLSKGDAISMVDKELRGFDKHQMETVLMIGLACCDIDHRKRPSMRLVVKMLAGERYDELMEMMVVKEKVEDVRGPSKAASDGEDFSTSHALNVDFEGKDQESKNVAYVLPPPPPPPLPPKGKEAIDFETGHRYYYSPETNESSWERPKAGKVIADQNKKPENSSTGPRESPPYTAVAEFQKRARYESIEKGKNVVEHAEDNPGPSKEAPDGQDLCTSHALDGYPPLSVQGLVGPVKDPRDPKYQLESQGPNETNAYRNPFLDPLINPFLNQELDAMEKKGSHGKYKYGIYESDSPDLLHSILGSDFQKESGKKSSSRDGAASYVRLIVIFLVCILQALECPVKYPRDPKYQLESQGPNETNAYRNPFLDPLINPFLNQELDAMEKKGSHGKYKYGVYESDSPDLLHSILGSDFQKESGKKSSSRDGAASYDQPDARAPGNNFSSSGLFPGWVYFEAKDQESETVSYVLPPPRPPPLPPLPPKWKEAIDFETGHRYYYSPKTNESSWERPKAGIVIADQNKNPENSSTGPGESPPYTAVSEFQKPARYESIEKGRNIVEHGDNARRPQITPRSEDFDTPAEETQKFERGYSSTSDHEPRLENDNRSESKKTWWKPFGAPFFKLGTRAFQKQSPIFQLDGMPVKFSYKQLSAATGGFSSGSIVGCGGFGNVYRGVLPSGIRVAVKTLKADPRWAADFLMTEVSILCQLRHRNVIELLGWCDDDVAKMQKKLCLVYEWMPNGSLDALLFRPIEGKAPSWPQRLKILTGIAAGVDYLHNGWKQQVVHRNVTCSNILLDEEYNAKLGGFALALVGAHDIEPEESLVAGTYGYLSPECTMTGKFTRKSDVFAFGVVGLEVVCGRTALDRNLQPDERFIADWVWQRLKEGDLTRAVDARLKDYDTHLVEGVLKIGLQCSLVNPEARPSMRQIVQMLAGEVPVPSLPPSRRTDDSSKV